MKQLPLRFVRVYYQLISVHYQSIWPELGTGLEVDSKLDRNGSIANSESPKKSYISTIITSRETELSGGKEKADVLTF